jgi:ribonuclease PH
MTDYLISTTSSFIAKSPIVDLSSFEETAGGFSYARLTIAVCAHQLDQLALVHLEDRVHLDAFEEMITCVKRACEQIFQRMDKLVRQRTMELAVQFQ